MVIFAHIGEVYVIFQFLVQVPSLHMLVVFDMFHKQCSISEPICFAQYKLPLPYMAGPVYRYSPATQYLKVRLASFIGIGLNDLNGFGHRRALDNSLHLIYLLLSKVGTF